MCPDDGAVDHLQARVAAAAVIEGIQDQLPKSRKRPAPELPVDRRPFAKIIGQVAPRRPGTGNPRLNFVQNQGRNRSTAPAERTVATTATPPATNPRPALPKCFREYLNRLAYQCRLRLLLGICNTL